jgi:peptidoglycan/xylan/chitin deacetylase (PgdA/CDA1 family)
LPDRIDSEPPEPHELPGRRAFLAGAIALTAAACSSSSKGKGAGSSAASSSSTAPGASSSTASQTAPVTSAEFVASGRRDKQQVALTFHTNGDRMLAEKLLETVEAQHVQITAFIVGSWLETNTDFAKRITDGGHELANHTYSHPTFPKLDASAMSAEVTKCRDVIASLSGSGGRWFRPSGTTNGTDDPGPTVRGIAAAAGYPTILGFDVDPSDYLDPGATTIVKRTNDTVQPGSIISLHFGHQGTIDALPAILLDLRRRGLEPVTVGTLLGA